MSPNILSYSFRWLALAVIALVMFVAGCTPPTDEPTVLNATQANQTVIARVTELAAQTEFPPPADATSTPTPVAPNPNATETAANESTPNAEANTPTSSAPTATSTPCDRAAPGTPIDVTIPDDTPVQPGETFEKIWRLQNIGSCTWTTQYNLVWFSGEQMSASLSIPLITNVAPGQTIDVAVKMVAPTSAGTFQSNWKLRNASGVLFGIGPTGTSPFWVRVEVMAPTNTPLPTMTPTPTITPSPTPTATPPVQVQGSVTLVSGNRMDLDELQLNDNATSDMLYIENSDGLHLISPQNNAVFGLFGLQQPTGEQCRAAGMSSASIAVESLSVGSYLCFRTNLDRIGWLRVSAFDTTTYNLSIDVLTLTQ